MRGVRTRTRVTCSLRRSHRPRNAGLSALDGMDAILVPGGFGERGIEGKIRAVEYARAATEFRISGSVWAWQVAVIEYARHVVGLEGANSTEFNRATPHPVIALITEWQDREHGAQTRDDGSAKGGTHAPWRTGMPRGAGHADHAVYGRDTIMERHRHRYEFNNRYLERMSKAGLKFSGFSSDGLVEMIELASHPWFIACQFHPEFTSTPRDGHPLFAGFIRAARQYRGVAAARCRQRMKLHDFEVGPDQPLFLIAGPCVVESESLVIDTAGRLQGDHRAAAHSRSSSSLRSTRRNSFLGS